MADYSPGPWVFDEESGEIDSSNGGGVAFLCPHGNVNTIARTGEPHSMADGRLIAAAPVLYESCKRLLSAIENYGYTFGDMFDNDEEMWGAMTDIRRAIKRADGLSVNDEEN